jgi:RimJ/RimL family protein N-acetyltransferase
VTRLETERLVLRPLGREDTAAYAELFEDTAELDRAVEHWAEHGFGHWAILDRGSGRLIGAIEVHYAGEGIGGIAPDEVEIGWTVAEDRRGEGIATEAARAAIDHAFATLDPPHLVAYIRPENEVSQRLAVRLGMCHDADGTTRSGDRMLIFRLPRPTTIDGRP